MCDDGVCFCPLCQSSHTHNVSQIGQVCADAEKSFHKDVIEFHFDDYQKILYITGATLRYCVCVCACVCVCVCVCVL